MQIAAEDESKEHFELYLKKLADAALPPRQQAEFELHVGRGYSLLGEGVLAREWLDRALATDCRADAAITRAIAFVEPAGERPPPTMQLTALLPSPLLDHLTAEVGAAHSIRSASNPLEMHRLLCSVDEPCQILELIDRVPAYPIIDVMLSEWRHAVSPLPASVRRAIRHVFTSPSSMRTGADLAVSVGMTRRSLYRYMATERAAATRSHRLRSYSAGLCAVTHAG